MNTMLKRVISLMLCLVLAVGCLPVGALAAETETFENVREAAFVDAADSLTESTSAEDAARPVSDDAPIAAAIFFSDLHTNKSDYKENTVKGAMNALKDTGLPFSSVTSCGDAFSVNDDSGKYTGDPSKITGYIQSVFAGIPVHYVWSDHDRYAGLDNDSGFVYGAGADGTYGTSDDDNYYIYELSMADLSTNNRYNADFHSNSEVTATIAAFVADAEKLDQTKPLFIAGHQPLLDRRNDNGHALEWATAINTVAENMDVSYFFGHNHKYDVAGDYYYAKGSTMSVCKDRSGNAQNVKLNFTHLCAGYLAPSSTGSTSTTTRQGTLLAVTIWEDTVQYVTYNANGEYTGSYAVNETVERDHAAPAVSLTSIEVTGTTEYTVGDELNLKVTATYDDGTTEDVTEEATFEPAELTASGAYPITASYGGMTDTVEIAVSDTWYEADDFASVTAVADGATLDDFWEDTEADALLGYWFGFDIRLVEQAEGTSATVKLWLDPEAMTIDDLAVYYYNETAGAYEPVTGYTYDVDEYGCTYIVLSDAAMGKYIYGTPAEVEIPEGAVLSGIEITNPAKVLDYHDTDVTTYTDKNGVEQEAIAVNISDMTVVATYVLDGVAYTKELDWNEFGAVEGYSLTHDPLVVDGEVQFGAKKVYLSYTYGDVTCTADYTIYVWDGEVSVDDVAIQVGENEFGVIGANVAESTNENVADAVANVLTGDSYVAYDIELIFAEGYGTNDAPKTVTLPIPEGVTNPAVYYVSDSGKSVVDMKAEITEDGEHVTFTTTHFSTYVVGEGTEIEVPENETATGTNTVPGEKKTVYVLASAPSGSVMIVNGNRAGSGYYAVANSNSSVAATGVTIKSGDVDGDGDTETYIELDDAADELWTVAGSYTFECEDGYLYRASSSGGTTPRIDDSSTTWSYNTTYHRLSYTRNNNTYYLYYSSGWKVSTSTSNAGSIYFYVPQEIDSTTTVSGTYSIDGADVTAAAVENATLELNADLIFTPASGTATSEEVSATYEVYEGGDPLGVISGISGNTVTLSGKVGKALVKVSYESDFGTVTDYITVTVNAPHHFGIQLHEIKGGALGEEIVKPIDN